TVKKMVFRSYLFDSGTSHNPSKPTFTFQRPPYVDRFKVLNAQIPSSFYSTGSHNNQVAFKEGENTYYATIPPGFYNSQTFPSGVQTAMNAARNNGYVVTYSDTTKGLTVKGTNAFSILSGNGSSTAWKQMGISKGFNSSTGTTVNLNVADFTGCSSLLLVSSQLISRDNIYLGNENIAVLGMIPLTGPPASVI